MQDVDHLGWAVTVAFRAGNHVLGVRADSEALGALLCELFADWLTPDGVPPGNLSVHLAERAAGGPQELHSFYETFARGLRDRPIQRTLGRSGTSSLLPNTVPRTVRSPDGTRARSRTG